MKIWNTILSVLLLVSYIVLFIMMSVFFMTNNLNGIIYSGFMLLLCALCKIEQRMGERK